MNGPLALTPSRSHGNIRQTAPGAAATKSQLVRGWEAREPGVGAQNENRSMLVYEYKLDAALSQYVQMDEAIRIAQFVRNKCLQRWMDVPGTSANDLQVQCSQLAKEFPFAARLNSQARQASADRAWQAINRFYANCRAKTPGKKGYPRYQHDNRSVEYKVTGWTLDPDGRHLRFTDGCGIGRVRLIGTRSIETFSVQQIKRVRLVRRADGYYAQFCVDAERQVIHVPPASRWGLIWASKSSTRIPMVRPSTILASCGRPSDG
jgi:putative transposase